MLNLKPKTFRLIPREHGSYVVLASCWMLGLIYARSIDPIPSLLVLGTIASAFLTQSPLREMARLHRRGRKSPPELRRWTIFLVSIVLRVGAIAAFLRPSLLWLALPACALLLVLFIAERKGVALTHLSLIAFAAMSLAAPATLIAADPTATLVECFGLWAVAAIVFCGSVYCVNIRLDRTNGTRTAIWFHLAAAPAVAGLLFVGAVPLIAIVAMLPGVMRLFWAVGRTERYQALPLKAIGIQETILAALFLSIHLLG